jgi:predicted enzyme related to lactoylglutathione lyase
MQQRRRSPRFSGWELSAADSGRARESYGELFGWRFQPLEDQDYQMSYDAGGAIAGSDDVGSPTVYFGVDDIDAVVARVQELGGAGGEKQEIPGVGYYAICEDFEGNRIGLYQDASAG